MSEPLPTTGSLAGFATFGPTTDVLWSRIAPARTSGTRRTILFMGTEHGVGTSTSACCAAIGLARNLKANVLLVEIGAGSSTLAGRLGLPEGPGFHELLLAGATLGACLRGCGQEGLAIVTAGRGVLPAGALAGERAVTLFEELGRGRDFVLIDAPPLREHPELHPVLQFAREAVLVIEADRTRSEHAKALQETVQRAGLQVIGAVLNRSKPTRLG
ncbi:MAG: hypothetical protein IPJ19_18125 [Planctomycetes bacterium]|nr:hypothetical protein [Planctomycetota bacterium]